MLPVNKIQYIKNNQINRQSWDLCIKNAPNSLIYAYSFFLDAICTNWDAIIINDYSAVMPIPWRSKLFLKYIYIPPFIQQLGVFNTDEKFDYGPVMDIINRKFVAADIFFNFANKIEGSYHLIKKTNYVLDLAKPWEQLEAGFNKDLLNNLKIARKENISFSSRISPLTIINLYRTHYASRTPHVRDTDYNNFLNLCLELNGKNMLFTKSIHNSNSEILAAGIFLRDPKRIYNIMNVTTAAGRKHGMNHYLLTSVIKDFAGQELLFDFEGSELPGVKEFYLKFGVTDQPYFQYSKPVFGFMQKFRKQ